MQAGVERFIHDMAGLGLEARLEAELVIYTVVAVDGAYAAKLVETGVSVGELQSWPQVPPHWLHFPDGVKFSQTNSQPSPKFGWLMHSRQITGWGDAPAGVAWASHVRAVLSEAVV